MVGLEESEHGPASTGPAPDHTAIVGGDHEMATAHPTKSPAFQFYPRDFLSSSKVDDMSMTERGIYITFLSRCWLDGGLPTDLKRLARMARMKPDQFERLWMNGPLHECFYVKAEQFQNERLDKERKAQADFRKRQKNASDARWNKPKASHGIPAASVGDDGGNALLSASASASANTKNPTGSSTSAEPQSDSPPVLTFPTVGKRSTWTLTEAHIAHWRELYPSLDVEAECRGALGWIETNNPKTAKGMPAFLVNWFNRAIARGVRPAAGGSARSAGNLASLQNFVNRGR